MNREIRPLHLRVQQQIAPLEARHRQRSQCRKGCADCCVDDLTVFEVEAVRIQEEFDHVLEQPPAPIGQCAFLDERGSCRIYTARPYVCRTQGLPLRWLEEDRNGDIVEARDICPKNGDAQYVEALDEGDLWQLGPVELELLALQTQLDGSGTTRVPLRSLFRGTSAGSTSSTGEQSATDRGDTEHR